MWTLKTLLKFLKLIHKILNWWCVDEKAKNFSQNGVSCTTEDYWFSALNMVCMWFFVIPNLSYIKRFLLKIMQLFLEISVFSNLLNFRHIVYNSKP